MTKLGLKIKNSRFLTAVQILFLLSFFGCTPSKKAICGMYGSDYDVAKERLEINSDGSFAQKVLIKTTGKIEKSSGKWEFDPASSYITFDENYMCVLDGMSNFNPNFRKEKGISGLPVKNYFGKISIGSSEGVVYIKEKESGQHSAF